MPLLKRVLIIAIISLAALLALLYLGDYAVFRYRVATNREAFVQVTVSPYDAVQQKNGKTVFYFDLPRAQTCVHSLFAHAGASPCWYLSRHTEPRTNL
jgi:hypothetical protein